MIFFKEQHLELLDKLKNQENELIKIFRDLPSSWFMHMDILAILEKVIVDIKKNEEQLKKSAFGQIEKQINSAYLQVLSQLENHIRFCDKLVYQIRAGKREEVITLQLKNSMKLLIDSLHKLVFLVNLYPINKIQRKKEWIKILELLRSGDLKPADIDQVKAKMLVSKFIDEELILALQYQSNESPYLMITSDSHQLKMHIIKKNNLGVNVVLSKLMGLFGIKHMVIDYKHKLVDGKVEHINMIQYIPGVRLINMGVLSEDKKVMSFAFFLGAACADCFVLNLSDRPINIHIDLAEFEKIATKNPKNFLGDKNPIFHIDYEFLSNTNPEFYIKSQIMGPVGVFVNFIVQQVDLKKAGLSKKDVCEAFNNGFNDELRYMIKNYEHNNKSINLILNKQGLEYIKFRLSLTWLNFLKEQESELLPHLPVEEVIRKVA